ncbi:hypothetical protein K0M31_013077 [Melipona bicolor]|uniref:Uncharacterized protein n=1 Tax=Melipona bicolor TaxID=60889 RepID=A0AA40FIL8_9HYME|nr:hypothetical protein K0M31_013077 [Melipona bicolor]
MDATEFYFRVAATWGEESPRAGFKDRAKAITHDYSAAPSLDVVPEDRGAAALEMAFRGGSVSKRGGQEVVDHDKGQQRLTKGKPRTSYKDPRDKRPMAPLLHL